MRAGAIFWGSAGSIFEDRFPHDFTKTFCFSEVYFSCHNIVNFRNLCSDPSLTGDKTLSGMLRKSNGSIRLQL